MPLYTYRCKECEHEFEIRQSFSEDALTDCPNCEQSALRKVINQVGVVFKGKGFYVNDSKSNNPAAPSGKAKENGSKAADSADGGGSSEKSESSSSDAKTAKAESKSTAATKTD